MSLTMDREKALIQDDSPYLTKGGPFDESNSPRLTIVNEIDCTKKLMFETAEMVKTMLIQLTGHAEDEEKIRDPECLRDELMLMHNLSAIILKTTIQIRDSIF